MVAEFMRQGFSKPLSEGPSRLWIPTDTLLAYDAVKTFVQTAGSLLSSFDQKDFENALASISFNGVSGELQFQRDRGNGHASDRDQDLFTSLATITPIPIICSQDIVLSTMVKALPEIAPESCGWGQLMFMKPPRRRCS